MNKIYDLWLNSSLVSKEDKAIMNQMNEKEKEVFFADRLMTFGTAGIRAKMGPGTQQMNEFTYKQMSLAYGQYIKKHFKNNPSVVIGHDNRRNSDKFSYLCAEVLTSLGIKVYLFKENKLTATPIISFVIRELRACGGLIVTASHNPKEYNGFKAYNPDGGQILPDVANEIVSYMTKPDKILDITYQANKNLIYELDDSYIQAYYLAARKAVIDTNILNEKKDYPIIFTGHHGTSCETLPAFLKTLNFTNVIPVKEQCFYNDAFINSPSSNPESEDSFDLAKEYAKKHNAKIIIGVDPDADRLAVMIKKNNQWRLMSGNDMGIIYTHYLLNNLSFFKQPFIVSSFVSTNMIDRIAKDFNAKVYRTGTGFKWMGDLITKLDGPESFVVAFEEAIGALTTNINRDKDSFTATALALEIYHQCLKENIDLIDYLQQKIFAKYGWWFGKTVSYTFDVLDWKTLVNAKMELMKNFKEKKIGSLKILEIKWNNVNDCLDWILENDCWLRFRMSGTEPKFKVYYNLYKNDEKSLQEEYNLISSQIKNILGVK